MKILYVGDDRDAAQRAAGALRKAGPEASFTWAGRLSDAMSWVQDNRDVSTLVVEDHVQNENCAWLVRQVRGLGLTAPLVVVSSKGAGPPLAALKAGADDYVANDQSLLLDLPEVVGRALRQAAEKAPARRLLRFLYLGDAALARESLQSPEYSIDVVELGRESNGGPQQTASEGEPPVDVLLVEHGRQGVDIFQILKDIAVRRLQCPVILVVDGSQDDLILPALRLGALDFVVKSRDAFQALVVRLDRVVAHFNLLKEQAALRALLEEGAAARTTLTQQINDTALALELTEQARVSDATASERLVRRQKELAHALEEASAAQESLNRRLADMEAALQVSEQRAADDRQRALHESSQREAEYKAQLDQELAARNTLQVKLTHAAAVVRVAAQRQASMKAVIAQISEREAQRESQLAQAAEVRETLEQQVSNDAAALEQAQQTRASAEAALSELTATRDTLQCRLIEAEAALQKAEECASAEREASSHAALQRQAEFEIRLDQEIEDRAAAEQKWERAEAASRGAAEQHAVEMTAAAAQATERHAQYEAQLALVTAARDRFEQQFNHASTALEQQVRDAATAFDRLRQAAAHEAMQRQAEFEARLDQEVANRESVEQGRTAAEQELERLEAAHRGAAEQHAVEMTAAAAQATERHAQYEAQLAQVSAARDTFEQQFNTASMALKQQVRDAASAFDRLRHAAGLEAMQRRAEFEARLDEEIASREARLDQEVASRKAVEENLARAEAAYRDAIEGHSLEMTAAAAQLAERHTQYETQLAEVTAARDTFEQQFNNASIALEEQVRDAATAFDRLRQAAAHEAMQRQAEFEARLDREIANRDVVEQRRAVAEQELERAEAAHRAAAERHASAMTAAAAHLAERQAQYETQLASVAAARDGFEQQLNVTSMALEQQVRDAATAFDRLRQAAAHEASQRQAEFEARLDQEIEGRRAVEEQLERAEAAHRAAAERRASEMTAAAAQLAERQAEYAAQLSDVAAARDGFEQQFNHASMALEQQVRDAATAFDRLRQAAAHEALQRQAEFRARLDQEIEGRGAVEQKLERAEAAHREAAARHASEMTAAAAQLAERQAEYAAQLSDVAAARDGFEQQFDHASMALESLEQARASEVAETAERLARQDAERAALVAETTAIREALEQRLSEKDAAVRQAEQRSLGERQAAAHEAVQRQSEFEARLDQEIEGRAAVERQLEGVEAAYRDAVERHALEITTAAAHMAERQAQYETQMAQEAAAHVALEQQLSDAAAALDRLTHAAANDASRRQAEFAARLGQETARRETLERDLAATRAASDKAQHRFLDEVSSIRESAREHESLLHEQAARERAEREGVLADLQGRVRDLELEGATLRQSLESSSQQIQHLEAVQKAEREDFERDRLASQTELRQLTSRAASEQALRTEASDRVAQLQKQLDETRAVHRRQFERTPSSMFRCGREGELQLVNDALAAMLGYRTAVDLQSVNLAATVFEYPDDLPSLIDRCFKTGRTESVETIWKKKDGVRFLVRLLASASTSGEIEIVAEDITALRELEDKLRQARRMEAVGRLASEVAATCDNLLRDVSEDGHQWLATIDSDTPMRHQGELLLSEVTRAASFLRQLDLYGKKEAGDLEPVDVNRVLHDLEPVLKRVAGDEIEFVLPKVSSPVHVDVESQRVERILVNMAAYGRERLPFGGRLTFELANVMVGRESVAEHPTFRAGAHVLITVTAVRYAVRWDGATSLAQLSTAAATASGSASDRPGVDLGAIQALIRDCGGHLWIAAEPPGDMVLKIHLPAGASERATDARAGVPRAKSGRPMSRWFRTRH